MRSVLLLFALALTDVHASSVAGPGMIQRCRNRLQHFLLRNTVALSASMERVSPDAVRLLQNAFANLSMNSKDPKMQILSDLVTGVSDYHGDFESYFNLSVLRGIHRCTPLIFADVSDHIAALLDVNVPGWHPDPTRSNIWAVKVKEPLVLFSSSGQVVEYRPGEIVVLKDQRAIGAIETVAEEPVYRVID